MEFFLLLYFIDVGDVVEILFLMGCVVSHEGLHEQNVIFGKF